MKVLVTHFSQTGNTEKVAKAIQEEAAQANEVELKKLEEISPGDVADYDFIFLGSPLHAANLAAPVKEFLISKTDDGSSRYRRSEQSQGLCQGSNRLIEIGGVSKEWKI
jgi:menaquinone-dependent protoporphyrinogen IX oxidase